ncbi:hypothetical protein F4860DRAFT_498782 [Xylaria cubensis]|nr:hypothetical protein F4860DRAFT_498782 [Xylaria cubensis]
MLIRILVDILIFRPYHITISIKYSLWPSYLYCLYFRFHTQRTHKPSRVSISLSNPLYQAGIMYNSKVLLSVAALTGTSLAQIPTTTDAACQSSLAQFADAPTVAPVLASYFASVIGTGPVTAPGESTPLPDFTLEDPIGYQNLVCSVAAELPASLLPEFKSYGSELLSYGSVHLSAYDAYITNCITTGAAAATLTSQLHDMLGGNGGLCKETSTPTPGGSSNGTYPTGTGSPHPTSSGSATLVPTAAAARPTGVLVGAAAIGGLLGAAALL